MYKAETSRFIMHKLEANLISVARAFQFIIAVKFYLIGGVAAVCNCFAFLFLLAEIVSSQQLSVCFSNVAFRTSFLHFVSCTRASDCISLHS